MKLLAFETSAKAVSVALLEDGLLIGEYYQNSGQTHSRTVMKLAKDLLDNCDLSPADLDLIAYANGPGSFTGIRIGVSAAKGLCWGRELPCLPVSTLEAMAYGGISLNGVICCCMDARRSQVYNALFSVQNGTLTRLCEDRAVSIEELSQDLSAEDRPVWLIGDGAELVFRTLFEQIPALRLTAEHQRQQRASGVALAGWQMALRNGQQSAAAPLPNYLRLSQAERERLAKEKYKGE